MTASTVGNIDGSTLNHSGPGGEWSGACLAITSSAMMEGHFRPLGIIDELGI